MHAFTYHSPEGDRPLFANREPKNGVVDLVDADGVLEIGSCKIELREGGCSPASEARKTSDEDKSLESKKVDELRQIATGLGIESEGLKKADLIEAIEAKQNGNETEI